MTQGQESWMNFHNLAGTLLANLYVVFASKTAIHHVHVPCFRLTAMASSPQASRAPPPPQRQQKKNNCNYYHYYSSYY